MDRSSGLTRDCAGYFDRIAAIMAVLPTMRSDTPSITLGVRGYTWARCSTIRKGLYTTLSAAMSDASHQLAGAILNRPAGRERRWR
jgi:hypothetical protein